jgi:hypothetical protein
MSAENTRAVEVGMLLINPETGWGKRQDDDKTFRLTRSELSMLGILSDSYWMNVTDIAFNYETAHDLNKAMMIATSNNEKNNGRGKATKIIDDLDDLYKDINKPLAVSDALVRVMIDSLRNKVGEEVIENRFGFGYRLVNKED